MFNDVNKKKTFDVQLQIIGTYKHHFKNIL